MGGEGLRVLVVDDEPQLRRVLAEVLEHEGFVAEEAPDGESAVAAFERHPADIVVTDVRMPGLDGLGVLARVKRIAPETCVVVMTGCGTEETVISALRHGASNYLKKPVGAADFAYVLGVLADRVRGRRAERPDPRLFEREGRRLRLGPDPGLVGPAVAMLTASVSALPFDAEAVRLGLHEMLANAVEHGSLGISRGEKLEALRDGTWAGLVARRAAEPPWRDRTVVVESEITPGRASFRIADEGEGFDWRALPEPADVDRLLADAGRGIVVTRLCMDEVAYAGRGNEVRISKHAAARQPA